VAELLQGSSRLVARTKAGVGRRTAFDIEKRLREGGTLETRPHHPPARKYTPVLLDAATRVLAGETQRLHTTPSFITRLRQLGVLTGPVNAQRFLTAWKKRQLALRQHISPKSTLTRPRISNPDAEDRLGFARALLEKLDAEGGRELGVRRCVFIDETTLEESSHPKAGASYFIACLTDAW
jgi:hypothetical protein